MRVWSRNSLTVTAGKTAVNWSTIEELFIGSNSIAAKGPLVNAVKTIDTTLFNFPQRPLGQLAQRRLELASENRSLALNFFLEIDDRLDQLFGPRRTARRIHVDRQETVDPLHDAIGIEHAAGRSARPHRNTPFRLGHLQPDALQDGQHLHHHAARHDHQVALPGG